MIVKKVVAWKRSSPEDEARGLLGFLRIEITGGLVLDGVTLRRTRVGQMTLTFPARRDRHGCEHSIVQPIDDASRRRFEREVFAELGIEREAQP